MSRDITLKILRALQVTGTLICLFLMVAAGINAFRLQVASWILSIERITAACRQTNACGTGSVYPELNGERKVQLLITVEKPKPNPTAIRQSLMSAMSFPANTLVEGSVILITELK